MKCIAGIVSVAFLCVPLLAADGWRGPRPPKPDVPYLLHADILVETEVSEAREEQRRNDHIYTISGASSQAKTPMAEPIFLFESDKIAPDSVELYRLDVRGGNRQVVISQSRRRSARPLRLSVERLDGNLYRIEVNEGMGLENGQYSLSPSGANQVFCFEVY